MIIFAIKRYLIHEFIIKDKFNITVLVLGNKIKLCFENYNWLSLLWGVVVDPLIM